MQAALCNHGCLGLLSIIFSSARCHQKFAKPVKQAQSHISGNENMKPFWRSLHLCLSVRFLPSGKLSPQDRELKPKGRSFCIQSPPSNTPSEQGCWQSPWVELVHVPLLTAEAIRGDAIAFDGTQRKAGPRAPCWVQARGLAAPSTPHTQLCRFPWCSNPASNPLRLKELCRGKVTPQAPDPQIQLHTGTLPHRAPQSGASWGGDSIEKPEASCAREAPGDVLTCRCSELWTFTVLCFMCQTALEASIIPRQDTAGIGKQRPSAYSISQTITLESLKLCPDTKRCKDHKPGKAQEALRTAKQTARAPSSLCASSSDGHRQQRAPGEGEKHSSLLGMMHPA